MDKYFEAGLFSTVYCRERKHRLQRRVAIGGMQEMYLSKQINRIERYGKKPLLKYGILR